MMAGYGKVMSSRLDYEKLTVDTAGALRDAQGRGDFGSLDVMVRFNPGGQLEEIRHSLEAAGLEVSLLLPGICSGRIPLQDLLRLTELDFVQKIDLPKMAKAH